MRNFLFFIILMLCSSPLMAYSVPASVDTKPLPVYKAVDTTTLNLQALANQALLPKDFPIYFRGTTVVNYPLTGYTKRILTTNNDYYQSPGCYIACFSNSNTTEAVYPATNSVFVYGQIRVPGVYVGRICRPEGFGTSDITNEPTFKKLCATKIPACQYRNCWGNGDTGAWFGIQ